MLCLMYFVIIAIINSSIIKTNLKINALMLRLIYMRPVMPEHFIFLDIRLAQQQSNHHQSQNGQRLSFFGRGGCLVVPKTGQVWLLEWVNIHILAAVVTEEVSLHPTRGQICLTSEKRGVKFHGKHSRKERDDSLSAFGRQIVTTALFWEGAHLISELPFANYTCRLLSCTLSERTVILPICAAAGLFGVCVCVLVSPPEAVAHKHTRLLQKHLHGLCDWSPPAAD